MQVAQQQPQPSCWTETAYDWWQRSKRARAVSSAAPPKDPASAAWAFCRPTSSRGTGIAFVDAALRRTSAAPVTSSLPVVDVRGGSAVGKTWTILSLAARFAVATRPSQFDTSTIMFDDENDMSNGCSVLPQVIILDSTYDVTTCKLSYAVRSTLLRKMSSSTQDDSTAATQQRNTDDLATAFERDMKDCLSRIHFGTADDLAGWVPLLECLRHQLTATSSDHPTLLLWDGFLSEPNPTEAARMEVIRQLERLLLECSVLLITTTGSHQYRPREYERFVTHRIRLDRNETSSSNHEYLATVHGAQIPFSISMAGILS